MMASVLWVAFCTHSGEAEVLLREDFERLDSWAPLHFRTIGKHTTYTIVVNAGQSALRAHSDASASALIYRGHFNVYTYPKMRWRWKVEDVYKRGFVGTIGGDDAPIRLSITFRHDLWRGSFWDKIKYGFLSVGHGDARYSNLQYIWANARHLESVVTSPYDKGTRMIPLQQGEKKIGVWILEDVNILRDYERAFGVKPPAMASMAIMNDSDNTGEESVSYVDFIEVYQ